MSDGIDDSHAYYEGASITWNSPRRQMSERGYTFSPEPLYENVVPIRGKEVYSCTACGALVPEAKIGVHTTWHQWHGGK